MTTETKRTFELTLPIAIVLGSLVIAGAIMMTRGDGAAAVAAADGADALASVRGISDGDHVLGSAEAPVVIVEYSDFQCPYCAMAHPTIKKVVESSEGKVALVYRDFPLDAIHPEARPAIEAAECVARELGNDAYWKFAETLFANQESLGSALYAKTAQSLGADSTAFSACTSAKTFDGTIDEELGEGASAGGTGTPFFVVIGKDGTRTSFSGALPYAQMKSIIDRVVAKQ